MTRPFHLIKDEQRRLEVERNALIEAIQPMQQRLRDIEQRFAVLAEEEADCRAYMGT